jgi:two-component system LytT family sensor kinase
VIKEIAPETLDVLVPGMLLQPLIENSIKHGLEPRISGGTVTLRSKISGDGMLMIEVEDDGVGISHERREGSATHGESGSGAGIGMRNVRERLHVQYSDLATVEVNSRPGRGTKVTLLMPAFHASANVMFQSGQILELGVHSPMAPLRRAIGTVESGGR